MHYNPQTESMYNLMSYALLNLDYRITLHVVNFEYIFLNIVSQLYYFPVWGIYKKADQSMQKNI